MLLSLLHTHLLTAVTMLVGGMGRSLDPKVAAAAAEIFRRLEVLNRSEPPLTIAGGARVRRNARARSETVALPTFCGDPVSSLVVGAPRCTPAPLAVTR